GEFGRFLQSDILPRLGVQTVIIAERDTTRNDYLSFLKQARHIVIATPLAGYQTLSCEIVRDCRHLRQPLTLWLIPSVQAGVWQAVTTLMASIENPYLAAVFVHPMYGPNGFRSEEREANTFCNILTATAAGKLRNLTDETAIFCEAFRKVFGIETITEFD